MPSHSCLIQRYLFDLVAQQSWVCFVVLWVSWCAKCFLMVRRSELEVVTLLLRSNAVVIDKEAV